jgi:predicted homoserine dehydrogenase-like protein
MHRLRHLAAATATATASPAMAGAAGDVVYPPQTPMDVKSGATKAEDVHFPLRWGIIGASRIGSDWIKCLADVPGASLAAVAARDMDRAQEYAEAHGIPTAYDSYQTLVDDPRVDIVYIGTKTDDHHAHTMLAIAAGKHVICEKPFCATEAQAAECFVAAVAIAIGRRVIKCRYHAI